MHTSKCSLHINLKIIQDNFNYLKKICSAKIASVVKANAYGLGMHKIVPALIDVGCNDFFVSSVEEGLSLRELNNDINIYVLNGVFNDDKEIFVQARLIPVLNHLEQIKLWQNTAILLGRKLLSVIHLDTGMNRLGMPEYEIEFFNSKLIANLEILYIMTHLAEQSSSQIQLARFSRYRKKFPNANYSFANSSGIFLGSEYHFDLVRPGGALYGINMDNKEIKNPIKLYAPIIQLQYVRPDQSIGYNTAYRTSSNAKIATISIGYADGFPRSLSNKISFFIKGIFVPVVGLVSMDLITIDVSKVEDVSVGDQIEIIGDNVSLNKIALAIGTNEREIITSLGNRYNRIYHDS